MLVPGNTALLLLIAIAGVYSQRASYQNTAPVFINTWTLDRLQKDGLAEDTPVGSEIVRLSAIDHERDEVTYSLYTDGTATPSAETYFLVNAQSGIVTLKQALDREALPVIPVTFLVTDQYKNTARNFISITIRDVNDNAPEFLGMPYRAQIRESSFPGTVVFTLSIRDRDVGMNAEVELACLDAEGEKTCDNFEVTERQISGQETTGVIQLKKQVDYESRKDYFLTIQARDKGSTSLSSTATVVIRVTDSQDVPPRFLNAPYNIIVSENTPKGTSVGVFQAVDQDEGVPNPITFSIVDDPLNFFSVDPAISSEGVYRTIVRSSGKIDRELVGEKYFFIAKAEEIVGGQPSGLGVETVVMVTVTDQNDNGPIFNQQGPYILNVPEALPEGSTLPHLNMIISDQDTSLYNEFELFILSDQFNTFSISPSKARGSAAVSLIVTDYNNMDFERKERRTHTVTIVAREVGSTPHSSTATVIVNLEDVNDHFPVFDHPQYNLRVREDRRPGDRIATITATDRDSGENGQLTYGLLGRESHKFSVDSKTGAITLLEKLDYEQEPHIPLLLQATDGGGQSSDTQLNITVQDTNDQGPEFLESYQSVVDEGSIIMVPAIKVTAIDSDGEGYVTYSITEGNTPDNAFKIDANSGQLELTRPLGFQETPGRSGYFLLTIEATDNGEPPQTNSLKIKIYVKDQNDNAPSFNPAAFSGNISELAPAGTSVVAVRATDNDDGMNAQIRYQLFSGHKDNFVIGELNGLITVSNTNNLDTAINGNIYNIIVHAVDRGSPPMTGTAQVSITIYDANNKNPAFTQQLYLTTVSQDAASGTSLIEVKAIDPDETASLEYTIREGSHVARDSRGIVTFTPFNYRNAFGVDRTSGVVSTRATLEPDQVTEVSFVVEARDIKAEQPILQTGSATVMVMIRATGSRYLLVNGQDASQNPVIQEEIPEGLSNLNDPIYVLVFTDPTTGNRVQNHKEVDGSDPQNYFIVNQSTGNVYLTRPIDYEVLSNKDLSLQVLASSPDGKTALATLIFHIMDVNDNNPRFLDKVYVFSVRETVKFPTQIGFIKATDEDSGRYGEIRYSLSGKGADMFYIIPTTGYLTIANGKSLDAEVQSEYAFMVEARDNPPGEGTQRSTQAQLIIRVLDENEIAPEFDALLPSFSVSEMVGAGVSVGRVQAMDQDLDSSQITYTITEGESELFLVESTTGIIRTRQSLNTYARSTPYTFIITASDNGTPPRSAQITVSIWVRSGTEEGAPRFILPDTNNFVVNIPEEMAAGKQVIKVYAEATNSGSSGVISYVLVNNADSPFFTLDSSSGAILTAAKLDREQQQIYQLLVSAQLQDDPDKKSSTVRIIVNLTDINDNSPTFRASGPNCDQIQNTVESLRVSLRENLPEGQTVAQLQACDRDISPNNATYFFILCGNAMADSGRRPFRLDVSSGILATNMVLDRESVSQYRLYIKVDNNRGYQVPSYDNDNCEVNMADPSILSIVVTVTDQDDNTPTFGIGSASFVAGIMAEAAYHTQVIQIIAYDPDIVSRIQYSLSGILFKSSKGADTPDDNAFTIDKDSGIVYTNKFHYMDYMEGYFETTVIVYGDGQEARKTLQIYVVEEIQLLMMTFEKSPEEIVEIQSQGFIRDVASALGGNISINTNGIRYHAIGTQTGKNKIDVNYIDYDKTDLCFHVIQGNRVLGLSEALQLFSDAQSELAQPYTNYEVRPELGSCKITMTTMWWSGYYWLWWLLIALAIAIFFLTLIVICCLCFCWTKSKRKIKRFKPYIILDPITVPNKHYEWQETTVRMG